MIIEFVDLFIRCCRSLSSCCRVVNNNNNNNNGCVVFQSGNDQYLQLIFIGGWFMLLTLPGDRCYRCGSGVELASCDDIGLVCCQVLTDE